MIAKLLVRLLQLLGLALLAHSVYSANQYKNLLLDAGLPVSFAPLDVALELGAALLLVGSGWLVDMRLQAARVTDVHNVPKSYEEFLIRPEFISLSHVKAERERRARALLEKGGKKSE